MMDWQRRRHPEDVPTPVAVAVADFCRRAGAPSSPATVRDALSLLGDDDDFRLRELADSEPDARPLGPFAVVDVVSGTAQPLAAQREETGYYTLVRELAERAPPPPPRPPQAAAPAARAERKKAAAEPRPTKKRKREQALSDRIAPRKRSGGAEPRVAPKQGPPSTSYLPRRELPLPRGRFTRVDSTRSPMEMLLKLSARDEVEALVDQSPTRAALLRTLELGYTGRKGAALCVEDVVAILSRHALTPRLDDKERGALLTALADAKGSLGRAAYELDLPRPQLLRRIEELELEREVRELRSRFAREALAPGNLAMRLGLVDRDKYLADLDIAERFDRALARDLLQLFERLEATGPEAKVALAAREHALEAGLLHRAVEKLGLEDKL